MFLFDLNKTDMKEPNYDDILKAKIEYYGETKAAYEFTAKEYARQYFELNKNSRLENVMKNNTQRPLKYNHFKKDEESRILEFANKWGCEIVALTQGKNNDYTLFYR